MNQVGRYQIQEELGRGAMGVVYKALDPAIGRTVAVKAVRLADFTDWDEQRRLRERLLLEAQSATVLSHPNIVAIYDVLDQEEFVYVFMEYVQGKSLDKILREKSLPSPEHLIQFLRQVGGALDYAHRKNIVHRDITPPKIILSDSVPGSGSQVKVAGFGIARFVSHEMNHNGSMRATASYMSPEQIQGTTIDGRSDQFSFAVVIYELLTGVQPFRGDDLPSLFYAICKQEAAPASEVNPDLTPAASKVLERALRKDPGERFASCGEFVGALSIALGEGSAPVAVAAAAGDSPVLRYAAASEAPLISIPNDRSYEDRSYEVPTRVRRHSTAEAPEPPHVAERSSGGKKLAVILGMCFAIVAAIVFIVLSNSGPTVPVQVLDSRSGPVSPPPEGMEVPSSQPKGASGSRAASSRLRTPAPASQKRQERTARATEAPAAALSTNSAPQAETAHEVELLSEPPGAKIVVDGKPDLTCSAPCTLSLERGRHTLTAELAGYNIARKIFTVPNDTSLFVNLSKSMGVVVVTSLASGCTVLVDGRPSGSTPATLHLTTGSHRIAVVSRGSRHEETVEVQTDSFDVERFICQ